MSVVFCDLVGSTRLADGMDPEDFREIVISYYQAANAVVERFGGHVAQYLGDGMLIYFGYPRAHEDDAERAVRAGLGIVDSIVEVNAKLTAHASPAVAVRVGIHTGLVVVGVGEGERPETIALGDTMNMAAALQGQAEPNTVVLSEATLHLVQGVFVTRDLGQRDLKGLTHGVAVYQAVRPSGVRSRLDVVSPAGLTPLIGRDQELGILAARFAQVEEGFGQAILVGGDPGIGKSRLVQAFRSLITDHSHTWLECRASPLTQDSALYAVLELQSQGLGFTAEDAPATKLERIETGLKNIGFDLPSTMPLMTSLHSLPLPGAYAELQLTPEARRKQTLDLLCEWLLRLSRDQAVVLMLEDLHWMDPSTMALLGQIMVQLPTTRVLLLATHRPEFVSPWARLSHVTPVQLGRLTRGQLTELIKAVIRDRDIPRSLIDDVVRRSDGVPLFAEELTHSAVLSNAGRVGPSIPETLQDSLASRLDALGPVRAVAQLSSVIGREFGYDLLRAVSPLSERNLESALATAVREEIFYQRGAMANATFVFKHALLRDAAYATLARDTRKRHHLRIAEAIVDRMPQSVEAHPELVAYHYELADRLEDAFRFFERAGKNAQRRSAHLEAIEHLSKAANLFARLPDAKKRPLEELNIQNALGNSAQAASGYAGAVMRKAYERAVELSRVLDDADERVYAVRGLAVCQLMVGDFDGSSRTLAELQPVMGQIGPAARGTVANTEGIIAFQRGNLALALSIFDDSIAAYDPAASQHLIGRTGGEVAVNSMAWSALVNWTAGYPDVAVTRAREAVERARNLKHPLTLALTIAFASGCELLYGNTTAALAVAGEALKLSEQQALPLFRGFAKVMIACAQPKNGEAITEGERGLAEVSSIGAVTNAPFMITHFAEAKLKSGAPEEALRLLDMARFMSDNCSMRFWDAEIRRVECAIRLVLNPTDDVTPTLLEALEIAEQQGARSHKLRVSISLARFWQSRGKYAQAKELLAPTFNAFKEGFGAADMREAKSLLEQLA